MDSLNRLHRVLLGLLVWLVAISGLVWASGRWGNQRLLYFDVPLGPVQALHVHIGPPSHRLLEAGIFQAQGVDYPPSTVRRFAVWYRDRRAGTNRPLLSTPLPVWPLAVPFAGVAIALLLVERRRAARHSLRSHRQIRRDPRARSS